MITINQIENLYFYDYDGELSVSVLLTSGEYVFGEDDESQSHYLALFNAFHDCTNVSMEEAEKLVEEVKKAVIEGMITVTTDGIVGTWKL